MRRPARQDAADRRERLADGPILPVPAYCQESLRVSPADERYCEAGAATSGGSERYGARDVRRDFIP
jgi:hypothetical protein